VLSTNDPLKEVLALYDLIIGEYLTLEGSDMIVATGLSQIPYDAPKYYYRLNSHEGFLKLIGIEFEHVTPLMARDFLIHFSSEAHAKIAFDKLSNTSIGNVKFFGDIDNRGLSLFITLKYPNKINEGDVLLVAEDCISIYPHVSFVAIKNGMHHCDGFAFFSKNLIRFMPKNEVHVKYIHDSIIQYFH
jgi:hypothetical protein